MKSFLKKEKEFIALNILWVSFYNMSEKKIKDVRCDVGLV
jgi:hypothetical protein